MMIDREADNEDDNPLDEDYDDFDEDNDDEDDDDEDEDDKNDWDASQPISIFNHPPFSQMTYEQIRELEDSWP